MVKYFTVDEIASHKNPEDCWVSIFDDVYDLSELIRDNRGTLANPLIEVAGTSISHWFNEETRDIKTFIDPVRNIEMPYTPKGRFIHVPPPEPTDKVEQVQTPWWKNQDYVIGKLTRKTMKIKITNMLSRKDDIIKICQEETISDIKNRYMEYNMNSNSYTWKALINGKFVPLKLDETMVSNGILDESEKFDKLGIEEDEFLPNIHIYYNDDLNYA
jgi:hypothetical protein